MKEEIRPIITFKVNVFMFNIRTMTELNSLTVHRTMLVCKTKSVCVCVCESDKSYMHSSAAFMMLYDWCLATVFSIHSTSPLGLT